MNESSPPHSAFGLGLGFGGDAPLGDQQDAENADQQDRALQEQRRGVDGDRSHDGDAADGAVQPTGQLHHRDERGRQPDQAEHHLHGVAPLARHERLDQHAGDGGAEHDQHRRQQAVLDAGRWQVHRRRAFRQFGCGIGLVDGGQRVADGRIDHVQSQFRIHAEHQQQRDQRCHHRELAGDQVTQPVVAFGDRAAHHPLVHPQDVDRGEHQRARRDHREHRVTRECADQHQEFADERRQAGKRQRRQPGDQERACQHRGDLLHAAVGADQASSPARHQESGDQEQRGGGDAVVDHVQRRAGLALAWSSRRCRG